MDFHIIHLQTVDSTNTYLEGLARKGYPHGTVVIADTQTSGRGRYGRQWFSPPGKNIYMSILLRPQKGTGLSDLSVLPLLAGVASLKAVEGLTGLEVMLKWPNDILLMEKKLGGILVESRIEGKTVFFIAGIGINVNMTLDELPEELKEIATSLYICTGREFSREELTERLLTEFSRIYEDFITHGKQYIISEWQSHSSTIGRRVRAVLPDGRTLSGRAVAVDENGFLLLDIDGRLEIIKAGDLFHEPDNH